MNVRKALVIVAGIAMVSVTGAQVAQARVTKEIGNQPMTPTVITISGRVVLRLRDLIGPANGAMVSVSTDSGAPVRVERTDKFGKYAFYSLPVIDGKYHVSVDNFELGGLTYFFRPKERIVSGEKDSFKVNFLGISKWRVSKDDEASVAEME